MNTKTNFPEVKSVNWTHVEVFFNGVQNWIEWDTIRRAALQDHEELREIYTDIYEQAKEKARAEKSVRIVVSNPSGNPHDDRSLTWVAALQTMSGESLQPRTVSDDWGLTGTKDYAERDAAEAREILSSRGYDVR